MSINSSASASANERTRNVRRSVRPQTGRHISRKRHASVYPRAVHRARRRMPCRAAQWQVRPTVRLPPTPMNRPPATHTTSDRHPPPDPGGQLFTLYTLKGIFESGARLQGDRTFQSGRVASLAYFELLIYYDGRVRRRRLGRNGREKAYQEKGWILNVRIM